MRHQSTAIQLLVSQTLIKPYCSGILFKTDQADAWQSQLPRAPCHRLHQSFAHAFVPVGFADRYSRQIQAATILKLTIWFQYRVTFRCVVRGRHHRITMRHSGKFAVQFSNQAILIRKYYIFARVSACACFKDTFTGQSNLIPDIFSQPI